MTDLAKEVREPISVSAAQPGWRALYVNRTDNTQQLVSPVVAWAVYELRLEDYHSGDQLPKVRRVIEGAVLPLLGSGRSGTLIPATELAPGFADLAAYLSPDDPDPEGLTQWPR